MGEKRAGECLMLGTNYFDCFLFTKRFGNNHSSLTSPAGPFIMPLGASAAVVNQSFAED